VAGSRRAIPVHPLTIHVVWHPESASAAALAYATFRIFCADPDTPGSRGLGIPVWFHTGLAGNDAPPPAIDTAGARRNTVIVLADDDLVIGGWDDYLVAVAGRLGLKDKLIVVMLTPSALRLPSELVERHGIRLFDMPDDARTLAYRNKVTHALCRQLDDDGLPVTVFVSHTKLDGKDIAVRIHRFIHEDTDLDDFFDATDIPVGARFAEVIRDNVGLAVLLAVQTDAYASREWCRVEALEAKLARSPIVVLDAVVEGQTRAFPYIGNVPVVRWQPDSPVLMHRLIALVLHEVLRARHFPLRAEAVCRLCGVTGTFMSLSYAPELVTALSMRSVAGDAPAGPLLYPDPPLGTEEIRLLSQLDPTLEAVTPTMLLSS
jgi:hypothetical protein